MSVLEVAVVGGGNGSYTMAGDFALAGHRVRMWPGATEKHAHLFREGMIRLERMGRTGVARLELVSDNLGEVVREKPQWLCAPTRLIPKPYGHRFWHRTWKMAK